MTNTKYFVIAKHWDDSKKDITKRIAGEFTKYIDAALFRDAYNAHYSANSYIVTEYELLNQ